MVIGGIYRVLASYYDSQQKCHSFKFRPALIIGRANGDDFIALPLSTVRKKQYLDKKYDVEIDPLECPELKLYKRGYVHTNKRMVVNYRQIDDFIGSMRAANVELYMKILNKSRQFDNDIMKQNIRLDERIRDAERGKRAAENARYKRDREEEFERDLDDDRDNDYAMGY